MTRRTDNLETSYRTLLLAYPAAYRAARGDEMLATLLDGARPGQRWPGVRETPALLVGGLRCRAGADRVRPARQTWAGGLRLAALVTLALPVAIDVVRAVDPRWGSPGRSWGWWALLALAACGMAAPFVAVARGAVLGALPLIAVAAGLDRVALPLLTRRDLLEGGWPLLLYGFQPTLYLVAVAAIVAIAVTGRPVGALHRSSAAATVLPAAAYVAPDLVSVLLGANHGAWEPILFEMQLTMLVAAPVVVALWAAIDARVAVAISGPVAATVLLLLWQPLAFPDTPANIPALTISATAAGALVVIASRGARRQANL